MIYDSDGNEFPYLQLSILSGQQSNVVVIGVDAGDYMLTATQDSNTQVLARRNGTSDAFQDISITPIDLSALSGRILFDVKIDTDSGITSARIVQLISRSLEGQANWAG